MAALTWLNHGYYEMKGVDEPLEICEVGETGCACLTAPTDSSKARRFYSEGAEPVLGWRPAVGQFVPNTRWLLEAALGEGGFGEVWLARHDQLKLQRVFKFCFNAERARSLKREATLFRLLREKVGEHPNVVAIYDVSLHEPPYYVVMNYVEGANLAAWSGLVVASIETRLQLVAQIADALQLAHNAGFIHRDVKPSNILITERGGDLRALLTDFGIGQIVTAETLAGMTGLGFTETIMSSGTATGTQMYIAPELQIGQPATTQSDIYSLGIVLYQVIVGDCAKPLAPGWERDVSDDSLRAVIAACVDGEPARRLSKVETISQFFRTFQKRRRAIHQRSRWGVAVLGAITMAALTWILGVKENAIVAYWSYDMLQALVQVRQATDLCIVTTDETSARKLEWLRLQTQIALRAVKNYDVVPFIHLTIRASASKRQADQRRAILD